ncbi:MAG TPA: hypothetical protein VGL27_04850 [Negativicutes bacterium]
MTILDKINAYSRSFVQAIVDKEPVSYLEAAGLYSIIVQGKLNISILSLFYKLARDSDLKRLTGEAIDEIMKPTIIKCENLLRDGGAKLPDVDFPSYPLYKVGVIPDDMRLTDMEVALVVGNTVKAYKHVLFLSMEQTYQLEITRSINDLLSTGLDWEYRLLQLMIHNGWLPRIAKVN